ncbi:hypothetical protein RRV45_19830 [Bacillus sp. DTU_2020_1000418_1_SI_GHA_SEK_038]|uniref:hypothetical protein n=1 Tax=Bacillus sp. DTU_2020_1000418_1_SI_GHA_SEK_038 TaxID=3077585 RepID=UPI0028EE344D|nr:hypothetical protein [Bacillus sp. DTU_2020_1000418_1_SI_GHA_SEK_038]WNS75101.1 hypothetical protein RRV45_19830 [Bacillus sp. DTU_2020_1000418_1_SI_GHA_SEK_038]
MDKRFTVNTCPGKFKIKIPQEYKINILKNELGRHKSIKVPNVNHSISGDELADWLLEVSSPREVDEIVLMIQSARRRGSRIMSLLQTIAAALIK